MNPRRATLPFSVLSVVWLTVVWVLLWGTFEVGTALAGLGIALLVTGVFRLPRLRLDGRGHPISLAYLLWRFFVDLVVASALTIPLGIEPRHEDVLAQPPRSPKAGIIDTRASRRIVVGAVVNAAGMLAVFAYFLSVSTTLHAQTMAFTTLVALEWSQAIGARSWSVPLSKLGVFTNRALVGGLLAGVVLQWVAVSSPTAERILGTDPLGPAEWAIAVAVGSAGIISAAIMTAIERRRLSAG